MDAVRENTYAVVAGNSPKRKPKAPKPIERPSKKPNPQGHSNAFRQQLEAARRAREAQ